MTLRLVEGGKGTGGRSSCSSELPSARIGIAMDGGGGKKWTFCYFWSCLDLPGRSLSKLVRDRADLDDEFLGLVSPGLMLVEKKAAVCSSKPGRLLPMVKSLSVE